MHEGYDAARSLHNGMIDRHPAAIAACSGVADVMHALEFAVKKSGPLSIKCGGHGLPGFAVCEDAQASSGSFFFRLNQNIQPSVV